MKNLPFLSDTLAPPDASNSSQHDFYLFLNTEENTLKKVTQTQTASKKYIFSIFPNEYKTREKNRETQIKSLF